ncbi:MAG: hypothetical protein R3F37_13680 [Candidatus Competibacteraceae bacterium]
MSDRLLMFLPALMLLATLSPSLSLAQGYSQSQTSEYSTQILKEEMSRIRDSNSQLSGRIKTAMEKLEEVAKFSRQDNQETQVNGLFITMREEIMGVLDQLGPNSAFADALNRAKEGTIVLKSWYERQAPEYPNRDNSIDQLDQAIVEYDAVDKRLQESRNLAQEKLATVIRQHRIVIQQMKIGKVLEAIASAKQVVEGLNDITEAIAVVEQRTNESLKVTPPPISQ